MIVLTICTQMRLLIVSLINHVQPWEESNILIIFLFAKHFPPHLLVIDQTIMGKIIVDKILQIVYS